MGDHMTAWQVATYLHVSRQRVEAIWRNGAYRFPHPSSESPRVWDRAEVEAWADGNWWGTRSWRVGSSKAL
jgi:hypothetical protein